MKIAKEKSTSECIYKILSDDRKKYFGYIRVEWNISAIRIYYKLYDKIEDDELKKIVAEVKRLENIK